MDFDLVLRDARLPDSQPDQPAVDIGVKDGRIAAIGSGLRRPAKEQAQAGGRLVCSGFVETHIHLDKSCILGRCDHEKKRFPHLAMERTSRPSSTPSPSRTSPNARAARSRSASRTAPPRMRTHVEVDPKVGLRGLEGVKALIDRYQAGRSISKSASCRRKD